MYPVQFTFVKCHFGDRFQKGDAPETIQLVLQHPGLPVLDRGSGYENPPVLAFDNVGCITG